MSNRNSDDEIKFNYWLSIGDLMSGALIIFILLFVLQLLNINKKLVEKEELLEKVENFENLKRKSESLEKVLGVKQTIIALIIDRFKNENLKIDIDNKTGNIKLDDKILFNFGSAELKPEGKEFLKNFIPKYAEVFLGDKDIKKYITQIVIEGHTDDQGSYMYNLDLSQRRALNVVKFIYSDEMPDFKWKNDLQKILTANGRSKIMPIKDRDGKINRQKSRRVEFQFRIDDEKANEEIRKILKNGVNDNEIR
ncbi:MULTISPECIES: OmpA family protein [unclassified Fusobacterium]|uniref:OmpA family protein n=1 Tax=unclassified Fusobacterium TaxID=2648384 RepID=UPI001B8C8176|nr:MULTISPECIES: OmpA family protein [unclassified Fusobacterium]MBR8701697.1 Outer membrane protein A [Fusobacterium sp. DD45]MBR8711485.1 Outer membrane protein A [Fusobacterium sp. DD28]MBR8752027.1 Outer membrane protein A [Fusobacterium sp. DD26]